MRQAPHVYGRSAGRPVHLGRADRLYMLRAADTLKVEFDEPVTGLTGDSMLFRYPWSDEDNVLPGMYEDPHRRYLLTLTATGHGADCRGQRHWLKYECRRPPGTVPVLSCDACGVYWAPVARRKAVPEKEHLIARALEKAADLAAPGDAIVLRAAAARIGGLAFGLKAAA